MVLWRWFTMVELAKNHLKQTKVYLPACMAQVYDTWRYIFQSHSAHIMLSCILGAGRPLKSCQRLEVSPYKAPIEQWSKPLDDISWNAGWLIGILMLAYYTNPIYLELGSIIHYMQQARVWVTAKFCLSFEKHNYEKQIINQDLTWLIYIMESLRDFYEMPCYHLPPNFRK